MSRFLDPLRVEETDEFAGLWTLLAEFRYESDLLKRTVVVPASFVTDFASVPRIPFAYLIAGGKGERAAVIHDYLYTLGKAQPGSIDRATADKVLREAMLACGYSKVLAGIFFAAVRVGGGSYWKDDNNAQPMSVDAAIEADALTLRVGA